MAVNRAKLERLIFIREIQASFIGVGLLLVVLLLLAIALTPRSITVRLSAAQFEQGSRRVVVHALDNVDLTKTLLTEETDATVSDGHLQIQWVISKELRDRPFIIEVCTTKNGTNGTEVCTKPGVGHQEFQKLAVKGAATDGALYSCPYYVSGPKTSFVASLLGMNDVELDSRVYCGAVEGSTDEFSAESRVSQIGQLSMNGMIPSGSGILTVKDGKLSLIDPASLSASTAATPQTTIIQQYYPTTLLQQIAPSDPAQTLVLTNRTLSISNGNSVLIPETVIPAADSVTDGLLTSADWNTFSSKENSLTFDSSLTRTGDTVGLMSCAVGEILKNNGSTWVCANDIGASSGAYTAGTGIAIDFANNIHNTGVLSVSASGALTATAGQSPAITLQTTSSFSQLAGQLALSATGVTSGNYNNVTVNTEGRVTSATNVAYLTTEQDGIVGNEVSDVVAGGGLVLSGGGTAANPYKVGLITACANSQILKWNGSAWACAADNNTANTDNQTLSYNPATNILTIAGGNTVDLSALKDNTDSQSIARTGNTISISGSTSTVDLTPYLDNTDSQTLTVNGTGTSRTVTISGGNTVGIGDSDNQTLSIAGNVISLTNGGSVTLPTDQNTTYVAGNGLSLAGTVFHINAPVCNSTTQKIIWNGSAFVCATDLDTDTDTQTLSWNNGSRTLTISGSASSVVIPDANTTYSTGNGLSMAGTVLAINAPACTGTNKLVWNGSAFVCAVDVDTNTTDFNIRANLSASTNISAGQTLSFVDGTGTRVTLTGNDVRYDLQSVGTAGTYGSSTSVPVITTDAQGRVVSVTTQSIAFPPETDAIIGNEVVGVTGNNSGLTRSGAGTVADPYTLAVSTGDGLQVAGNKVAIIAPTCTLSQKLIWNGTAFVCSTDINTDSQSLTSNTSVADSANTTTTTLSISGGNSVQFVDRDTLYSAGSGLAISGTTFSLAQQGATNGQVLKWNGSAWVPSTIMDTDAQTLGYNAVTRELTITGGNTITFPFASSTGAGLLSSADWTTFSGKENVLTFGDGLLRAGNTVGLMDCAAGQILQRNGTDTAWLCANQVVDTDTNTTYSAGTGISINGSNQISATLGMTIDGTEIVDGTITAADLATIAGLTPGTYNNVTVNAQGQVVGGTNVNYLTSYTETDGIIGNEVAGVVASGGLVMTGSGTSVSPYKLGLVTTCSDGQLLKYTTAGGWACANDVDTDTNTDAQSLSWNAANNILTISGGNTVDLSSLKDNTDSQTLTWDSGARTISISGGNTITLPTDQNTTYSSGDGVSLTGTVFAINAPTCSLSQKLIWTGTAFSCENDIDTDTDTDTNTTYSAGDGLALSGTTFALDRQGASAGQVLAWDGTKWAPYSPSAFSDTDDQTLSYNTTTRELAIDGGNTVTFPLASSTTAGLLSASDWNTFNGKENILTFSDGIVRSSNTVALMDCAANQILQRNGTDTAWLCANQVVDTDTNTTYTAGTGLALTGTEFSNTGVLSVTSSGALTTTTGQNPALTLTTTSDFSQVANQLALSTTGVTAGTYNGLTVDAQGRVTNATQMNYLTSENDGVVGNEVTGVINGGGLVMTGAGTSGDPYKVGMISTCNSGQLLKWIGGQWVCASDTDTNTDAQTLTFNSATGDLSLTNGGTVKLSSLNTDNQSLSLAGNTLTLTSGGSVDLTPYLDNTDNQSLTISGNTITLTNGGSITLPADQNTTYSAGSGLSENGSVFAISAPTCSATTQKLIWDGSAFVCATDQDTDTNTDAQTLSWDNGTRTLTISGGNNVVIPSDNTDTQDISYDSATRTVSLTDGGSFVIPLSSGTTSGLLSAADWATFSGKENVLTFGDGLLRSSNAVTLMDCAANQILQRDSADSAWVCANQVVDTDTNTTYSAGTGITIDGSNQIASTLGTSIEGLEITDGTITSADLATIAGLTAGTYNNVTVNAQGQVTSGTNVAYLTAETDAVVGNEVANVTNNGGLVMTGSGTAGDPYKVGLVTTCSNGQLLKYTTVGGWACATDIDTNTDAQTLSWNTGTNILTISGGNTVDLSSLKDNTDAQAILLSGDILSISGNAATVDLSKYADNTDSQTLTWDGGARTVSISGGNTITLPVDQNTTYSNGNGLSLTGTVFVIDAPTCTLAQKLIWTGTAFSCATDIDTDTDTNTTYSAGDGLTLSGTTFALDQQGAATGQVLAWDGSKWAPYTPTTFSDTDNQTLSYNAATRELTIADGNSISFPLASATGSGLLSSADWTTFSGKENILTFSDGILRGGDTVTLMDCAANQILQRNSADTAWLCASQVTDTNTTYAAGTGLSLTGNTFANTGVLSVTASGALSSSGGQNPAITLATTSDFTQLANQLALSATGVTAGTYNGLTVDAQGRVTGATDMSYLTSEQDGTVGNEVAGVINGGGLVMTGSGTTGDPYKVGMVTTCASGQLLKWIGGQWVCANDTDTDTDAQTLTFNSTTGDLSLTSGGTVNLNSLNTDSQTLSLAGNTLSLVSGGSVDLSPYLDNTDNQTLSLAGNTISLTNGGSITLPTDQNTTYTSGNGLSLTGTVFAINAPTCSGTDKLQWNGSAFVCATDVDTNTDAQTLTWDNGTRTLSISGGNNVTIPDTNTDAQTLSYDAATRTVSLTNGGSFTLPLSSGTTTGLLSAADWSTFNGKENVLTFSDGLARTSNNVALMDCAASQILQRNTGDTAWVCANQVTDTNTTYTAGTGLSLTDTTFANTGVLTVTASGALTSSGGQNPALSLTTTSDLTQLAGELGLSDTGVTAGTYNNVTVDDKGRVTAGTNVSYLTSYTETDGIVGNEIANVTNNGGLVMTGAGTTSDPYKVGMVTTCSDGQLLKYTALSGWACASDIDTNTDQQTLSWNSATNVLSLANGGSVDLSALKDNTDSQTLSIAGNVISLTNGGSVTLPADQNTTYTSGNGISLTGTVFAINAPTCSGTTAKLLWSGTAFTCGTDVDTDTNTIYDAGSGLSLTGTTFALAQQGASTGQVLKWNGSAWTPASDIDTNTDQQTLSYNNATRELTISGGNTMTFPLASSTGAGLLSSADWTTFNGKENILTFSDGLLRSSNTVTLMDCAADQILQRNAGDTAWLCANQVVDTDTNTTYTAGTGLSLTGNTFANTGTLSVSASGALTSSGGQNPAITLTTTSDLTQVGDQLGLNNTGVTSGTYNNVTVDAKGRVTAATNVSYLTSETDGVVGNEVAGVAASGGLVMTGAGTALSPYKVGLVTTCSDGQLLKYTTAGGWACATDIDTNTDAQALSYNATTNILTLANGGTVDLSDLQDNTDSQTLTVTNPSAGSHTIAISGGNSQSLVETQDLSWNSATRALSITGGTTVTIADANTTYSAGAGLDLTGTTFSLAQLGASSGQVLKWNGTAWAPAADIDTDTNTTYSAGNGLALTGTTFSLGSCSAGQIFKYNGTAWACSADVDTNTDAQTLSYNASTRELSVSGGNTISFPLASATGAGLLSSTDWSTFNGKENVLTFSDGLARTSNSVTLMDCAASQILQRNTGDTAWVCANQVTDTNTTYTAGTGLSLTDTTFANTGVLTVTASGALTSSGGQNPAITLTTTSDLTQLSSQLGLSNTGVTAGTYNNVTVDAKGRVTAATNVSYLTSEQDAVIGNEVAGVVANGGLVMTGSGTTLSPYKVGMVTTCSDGQLLKYTALSGWACANDTDTDTNTDAQTLSWNGTTNILTISGGNTVDLTSLKDNTDSQTLSIAGNVISLTNGGSVTLPADQNTTYTSGNGISLTGTVFAINAPTCSGTTKLQWNGTAFVCSADVDTNTDAQTLSYNSTTRELTISGGNLVTFPLASSSTTGLLSSTDWTTFNGKENVLTFTGNGLFSRSGTTITGTTCTTNGEIMKWNGTAWACAADNAGGVSDGNKGDITVSGSGVTWTVNADSVALGTDTTGNYVAGATSGNGITVSGTAGEGWSPAIAINAPTCTAGQYLTWNGSAFSCGTPTDTNTTNFNISANGAGSQNIAAGNTVNFQNGTGTTATVDASKNVSYNLTNTGVTANTYGSTTTVPQITVDAQGRITGVTTQTIAFPSEVDGVIGNEVTNATTNGGLVRGGSGTSGSPYTLGLLTSCTDQQLLKWTLGTSTWGCAADQVGVSSLNSLNGGLTLAAGTTGTDFNVSTAGSTITYNLPSASTTARGAVTTGAQTFGGAKTFNVGAAAVGFQVTDGTLPHFSIDTTNKTVQIGGATADANAITLVLDGYNVATDPTGTNGAMYYNSARAKFRCYQAGAWRDCITESTRVFVTGTPSNTTTSQVDVPGMTAPVEANRTYIVSCKMAHKTAATTTAGLFSINGPASNSINFIVKTGYTATAEYQVVQTAMNAATNPSTGPGATPRQVFIDGTFTTTAAGTFAVRYASEVGGSAVTVQPGSFCTLD